MESNTGNVLFRITGISTIVSLICWLIFSFLKPRLSDTKVLSDYFLSTLKLYKICERLSGAFLYLFIFLLGAVIALFLADYFELPKLPAAGVICIILGIVFFIMILSYTLPVIINKPEVQTVTVTDTYAEYRGAKFKSWHYGVCLSNGTKHVLPYEEYAAAQAGDQYYAVMCGHLNIGIYKTSDYTVP